MNKITIALVGKISEAYNSYSKVQEAVNHAASSLNVLVDILWVDSVDVNKTNVEVKLQTANGIILLGGFGENGTEGMIEVARFARENNVPLLGICLGMQIIIIEFARNVLGFKTATSTEFDKNTLAHRLDGEARAVLVRGEMALPRGGRHLWDEVRPSGVVYELRRGHTGYLHVMRGGGGREARRGRLSRQR